MKATLFIDRCLFKYAITADTDNLGLCHQETSPLKLLFIIGKRGALTYCQFFRKLETNIGFHYSMDRDIIMICFEQRSVLEKGTLLNQRTMAKSK